MKAYYNEHDPKAAAWLRELMRVGAIMDGVVDERSIAEVRPADLVGFARVHFFAGIGGWDYALKLAGWPADRPIWTGSCPCQPFSAAGRGRGHEDARHLWPEFQRLIAECRPPVVLGEQVASRLGRTWLAAVRADLEELGYGVGAADLCAAGVGAPHIRQRLYWVAESGVTAHGIVTRGVLDAEGTGSDWGRDGSWSGGPTGGLADDPGTGLPWWICEPGDGRGALERPERLRPLDGLGHADQPGPQGRVEHGHGAGERAPWAPGVADPWADLAWLPCRDGKARPTQPGIFPLAHGVPGRVGLLRGAGNAIVPILAAAFIEAYRDARGE